ncbi:hypothetical protein LL965_16580 [Xanthomonas cassavae CFBP 4642]|uniref:Uncharacterized protein n=1 Tax=Xanthomonas cassavae CFBP 4642 TaxID=1219375 RepID=A0ABS8HHH0_9XANT|nr:hypothetical protein [Xanthomonas cassavae]MCC4621618.1 hypothetical protein [Xanthomonas cassavae CFBP 4642]
MPTADVALHQLHRFVLLFSFDTGLSKRLLGNRSIALTRLHAGGMAS